MTTLIFIVLNELRIYQYVLCSIVYKELIAMPVQILAFSIAGSRQRKRFATRAQNFWQPFFKLTGANNFKRSTGSQRNC